MAEDPRRAIIDVMARLGKETQLHLDERQRHFQITDVIIMAVSFLLVVLAVFNVYYVRVIYKDMGGIVDNMDSMYSSLKIVDQDMLDITLSMKSFDGHMQHMQPINDRMTTLAGTLPNMSANMSLIKGDMGLIQQDMGLLYNAMGYIDQRILHMRTAMPVFRENMRVMAGPMDMINPFMP